MAEELAGGYNTAPLREGNTVVRSTGTWSVNVHALLRHFENAGFTQAPRFISADHEAGTETLSYIAGQPGTYPLTAPQRSDEALTHVAATIHAMHDATTGFIAPEPGNWQYRTTIPVDIDCIGHNDLGPYNTVYDGTKVTAIIDWDFAGPSHRLWDLCYAAHRFIPLSAPRSTKAFGWDPMPDQAKRLRLFTDTYGHCIKPVDLLDLLIVRLASIAANIEKQIRLGNPKFNRQRDERHTDGYREDIRYILSNHQNLCGEI
ncbi:MAG: phosphotransferase [Pseudonocardiaceae bacterium]